MRVWTERYGAEQMTRQNEFDRMLAIVRERYGGDLKQYLMEQTPAEVDKLLRSHPSRETIVAIILAAHAALAAMDGPKKPKRRGR